MPEMTPVNQNSPLYKAWLAYQVTEEYRNTRRWALDAAHVDGSLWAAFVEGFNANMSQPSGQPNLSEV